MYMRVTIIMTTITITHAEEAHQEAPVPGQVKLTPEAVKQAGIETAPVVLGPFG